MSYPLICWRVYLSYSLVTAIDQNFELDYVQRSGLNIMCIWQLTVWLKSRVCRTQDLKEDAGHEWGCMTGSRDQALVLLVSCSTFCSLRKEAQYMFFVYRLLSWAFYWFYYYKVFLWVGYTNIFSISLWELLECKPLMSHVPPNLGWLSLLWQQVARDPAQSHAWLPPVASPGTGCPGHSTTRALLLNPSMSCQQSSRSESIQQINENELVACIA